MLFLIALAHSFRFARGCAPVRAMAIVLLGVFLFTLGPSVSRARTWTDQNGRQIEAKFVREYQGQAILKQGAKVVKIPLTALSDDDQQFIKNQKSASKTRTWETGGGRLVRGKFVKFSSGSAHVRVGARLVEIPFEDLGVENQGFVRERLVALGREGELSGGSTSTNPTASTGGGNSTDSNTRLNQVDPGAASTSSGGDLFSGANLFEGAKNGPPTSAPNRFPESTGLSASSDSLANSGGSPESRIENPASRAPDMSKETERTWTDYLSRKTRGTLVRIEGNQIVVLVDSREVNMPLSKLSYADQQYVRRFSSSSGQGGRSSLANASSRSNSSSTASSARAPSADRWQDSSSTEPITASNSATSSAPSSSSRSTRSTMTNPQFPKPRYSSPGLDDPFGESEAPPEFDRPSRRTGSNSSRVSDRRSRSRKQEKKSSSERRSQSGYQGGGYECSECGKGVKPNLSRCPHCDVRFDYTEHADGSRSHNWSRLGFWALRVGVFLIIGFIGAIVRSARS